MFIFMKAPKNRIAGKNFKSYDIYFQRFSRIIMVFFKYQKKLKLLFYFTLKKFNFENKTKFAYPNLLTNFRTNALQHLIKLYQCAINIITVVF